MTRGVRHIGGSPRFGGADRLKPTYTIPTSKPGISLNPYSDLQIVPSDISWSNRFDLSYAMEYWLFTNVLVKTCCNRVPATWNCWNALRWFQFEENLPALWSLENRMLRIRRSLTGHLKSFDLHRLAHSLFYSIFVLRDNFEILNFFSCAFYCVQLLSVFVFISDCFLNGCNRLIVVS